jgi:large subunit ribosomal protein L18e
MPYIFSLDWRFSPLLRADALPSEERKKVAARCHKPESLAHPKLYKRFPHLLACSLMSEESAMGKKNSKTNPNLVRLIQHLKDAGRLNEAPVWRDIALRLEGPAGNWAEVNIGKLNRYANENDVVVIPGKLLGSGEIAKKVTVAAYRFSGQAKEKISNAGGQNLTLEELVEKNPKGSKVKLMG